MPDESTFDQRGQKVFGPQINVAGNAKLPPPPLVLVPHLPPSPRDFTGRDEELQELLASFDRGATITGLRGMGGIGKTALAYALAEKLIERYPDGQILVELRGTDPQPMTPAEAMARVVRAYHPEVKLPESESELAGIYNSVLHGMRALLLLDNAADDRQVRTLLPPPTCGVIVTSRRKFSLSGLMPMDLDVLETDKAVELLLKLCKPGASPSVEILGDKNLKEIARLCGFLPLALRAAGSLLANSPDLSPARYARELQDERQRLERIGKEGVDLDVDSSFGLSYGRLKPETAAVFRLLSIFPTDFDAAAEEVVCQDNGHRLLSELVRWSLVEYQLPGEEIEGRYHLHDLVRIFAASRMQAEEKTQAQQRHARHYQGVLLEANDLLLKDGESMREGLDLFDSEWPNIQAGQVWADNNMAISFEIAQVCSNFAWAWDILSLRLHLRDYAVWLQAGQVAARQIKNKEAESAHLGNLGLAYFILGNANRAIDYQEQALAIAREIGDRRSEGAALGNLGIFYASRGDTLRAIEYYEKALAIAREIGDRRSEGASLGNLGSIYYVLGDAKKAIEFNRQALAIARETGNRRGEGAVLGNLGSVYYVLGDAGKAIEYYKQHLAIAREIGDREGEGKTLFNTSLALDSLGKRNEAIKMARDALQIFEQIESPNAEQVREQLAEWHE